MFIEELYEIKQKNNPWYNNNHHLKTISSTISLYASVISENIRKIQFVIINSFFSFTKLKALYKKIHTTYVFSNYLSDFTMLINKRVDQNNYLRIEVVIMNCKCN